MFALLFWGILYLVMMLGGLLAAVILLVLLSAGPVILASESASTRAARAPAWRRPPGQSEPAFWCWQAVASYLIVLLMAALVLTFVGLDPHGFPVPFLVYGLSLGLGLTLWDRRRRSKERRPRGRA